MNIRITENESVFATINIGALIGASDVFMENGEEVVYEYMSVENARVLIDMLKNSINFVEEEINKIGDKKLSPIDVPLPVKKHTGRKPGSKNKPKTHLSSSVKKHPGRKPGSKNKPKLALAQVPSLTINQ